MAYKINEECTSCGACVPTCPVNAIFESPDQYKIDEATCIECGACQSVCPVSAIDAPK